MKMSNIANITVFDGAATPVSHTLVAISVTRKGNKIEAFWREALSTLPEYAQVRATMVLEKTGSGVWRTDVKVEVPIMEAVSGQNAAGYTAAPKVAYVETQGAYGWHHQRSSAAERKLCRQMLTNILGNISTSVTPATTGFAPELIDQLISAT